MNIMSAVSLIGWLFALYITIKMVFVFVGSAQMVAYFPEGNRRWLLPVQLLSLASFAAVVLFHPF